MRRNFHHVKEPLIMIVPMIDIMLFLLVFFMLSTMYMVNTNTVQVNLPQASAASQETRPIIISITVTDKGKVFYDLDSNPIDNLGDVVSEQLKKNQDTVFVIRGDKKAEYQYLVNVLNILKLAGTRHVSIATEAEGN